MDQEAILKMVTDELRQSYANCGVAEICEAAPEQRFMVKMRDGVALETFVTMPKENEAGKKYPVIVQRTCYPFWDSTLKIHGIELAKRGYIYVYQYCRGQHGSEGEWQPNIHEREDGIDLIEWLSSQPWAGRIGVWGRSYGALVGWAMADAVSDKVASMFLGVYGTDRFVSAYQKGSFRHDVLTSWTMQNAGYPIEADYIESCKYRPQIEVDEAMWGGHIDWYRDYIVNPDEEDDYWQSGWWKTLREIPAKVTMPLYIVSGWYDHHHGSSMKTWERLNETSKAHSWLEITGQNHFQLPCLEDRDTSNDPNLEIRHMLEWFHLTLAEGKVPQKKATFYEIGVDQWREFEDITAPECEEKTFYLDALKTDCGGKSLQKLPSHMPSRVSYDYDPDNPVMTHGGEAMLTSGKEIGSLKQPGPDYRPDVVSFTSDPLEADAGIFGKIKVDLWVTSDCEDTAFTAKLMEVRPDGTIYNIRSSITTIAADLKGEEYVPGTPVKVEIDMWEIFYHVNAGCQLRLDISSSDFPQYNIHTNYKGCWALQKEAKIAHQTILCGEDYPSDVRIPVLKD